MSLPKIALVVTTIGDGDFLDCYSRQAEVENTEDNLEIIETFTKFNCLIDDLQIK